MRNQIKETAKRNIQLDRSITKIASVYMCLVILFYMPVIAVYIADLLLTSKNGNYQFAFVLVHIFVCCNSFVNAVSFILVNRKVKQAILLIWSRIRHVHVDLNS